VPLPEYVTDPGPKSGIPFWMMPILLILPLWGIAYMGAFGNKASTNLTPAQIGAQVFTANCASCHGGRGEGGVGPKLAGGEAKLTFPNEADHIDWVHTGSASKKGQPYGDPARPGGQHVASSGGMPAFAGQLSDAQISAVVAYERDSL
jgi:mono/diheme cytochrome c family protein